MKSCQEAVWCDQNINNSRTVLPSPKARRGLPNHIVVVVAQCLHCDHGAVGDDLHVVCLHTAAAVDRPADTEELHQTGQEYYCLLGLYRVFLAGFELQNESVRKFQYQWLILLIIIILQNKNTRVLQKFHNLGHCNIANNVRPLLVYQKQGR